MKKARKHVSRHLISSFSDAAPQCALVGWQHRRTAVACARRSFLLTWCSLTYLPSSARVKVVRASRLSDMKCTALSPSDSACTRARAACLITSSSVCNVVFLSPWRTCGWQDRVDARHHQGCPARPRQGPSCQRRRVLDAQRAGSQARGDFAGATFATPTGAHAPLPSRQVASVPGNCPAPCRRRDCKPSGGRRSVGASRTL